MTREAFTQTLNKKFKLIRTEFNYSQDKMSEILGISKKTIVQIEKGRSSLGWMGAVAICSIFSQSEIIAMTFGGQPNDIIISLSFNGEEREYHRTMGGKVWWNDIDKTEKYKLQKNIISQHYRILDSNDCRISSSFDYEYIKSKLRELNENIKTNKI